MGARYLIDTNVIIDFAQSRFDVKCNNFIAKIIDDNPIISVITQIELLGFSHVPQQIITFTEFAFIANINQAVVSRTIELRKKYKIKLPDAIIAATAIVNDLILITHNVSDFKSIVELKLCDSHKICKGV